MPLFGRTRIYWNYPIIGNIWSGCTVIPYSQRILLRGQQGFSLPLRWNITYVKISIEWSVGPKIILTECTICSEMIGYWTGEIFHMESNRWTVYPTNPKTVSLEVVQAPYWNVKSNHAKTPAEKATYTLGWTLPLPCTRHHVHLLVVH